MVLCHYVEWSLRGMFVACTVYYSELRWNKVFKVEDSFSCWGRFLVLKFIGISNASPCSSSSFLTSSSDFFTSLGKSTLFCLSFSKSTKCRGLMWPITCESNLHLCLVGNFFRCDVPAIFWWYLICSVSNFFRQLNYLYYAV